MTAPDGYLRAVLADGARPFWHRTGVRELLGVPADTGVRVSFPVPPAVGFVYLRHPAFAPRSGPAAPIRQVQFVEEPWADPTFLDAGPVTRRPGRRGTGESTPPGRVAQESETPGPARSAQAPVQLQPIKQSTQDRAPQEAGPTQDRPRIAEPLLARGTVPDEGAAPEPPDAWSTTVVSVPGLTPPPPARPRVTPGAAAPEAPVAVEAAPPIPPRPTTARPMTDRSPASEAPAGSDRLAHRVAPAPREPEPRTGYPEPAPRPLSSGWPPTGSSAALNNPAPDHPARSGRALVRAPESGPRPAVPGPSENRPEPAAPPPDPVVVAAPDAVVPAAFWDRRGLGRPPARNLR